MHLYLVKTPRFIQSLFKDLVWSFSTSEKKLYLTFDDGPTPEITSFILQQLENYNAKATFFCVGENIEKHPEIFKQILHNGHAVGNHTHNHLNGWKTSTQHYIKNIDIAQNIIEKHHHSKTNLFRPPYGKIKRSQIKELKNKGYKIIMWDILSGDFDINISTEKTFKNILRNTKNGSIIVMHDHQKSLEKLNYCLPKILEHYTNLGYTFEKIT